MKRKRSLSLDSSGFSVVREGSVGAVVAVCTLASGVGCSLPFLLGFLGPDLRDSLSLSRGQLGLVISLFFGGTGMGSLAMGRVAAECGARLLIAGDLAVVALSFWLISVFGSYAMMLVAAAASGIGYALVNIGSNLAVSDASPVSRIGLNMSIKTAGVPIMATVMAMVAAPAVDRFSYQTLCSALALVALGTMLATLWSLPAARRGSYRPRQEGELAPGFFWIPVSAFLLVAGSQPLLSWIVTYAHETGYYSAESAGIASAVGTGVGAMIMLLVAARSDQTGAQSRAAFVSAACALCALGTVIVWLGGPYSFSLLVLGTVVGISGTMVAAGMTHALVVDHAPAAVGRGSGFTLTGYYAGALVSPFVFGLVADGPGGYSAAWAGCTLTMVLATFCYWRLQRRTHGTARIRS